MKTLSLDELKSFMQIIEEIGSIMSLSLFCNKFLSILRKYIPYEYGHFTFYDPNNNLTPLSYRYNIAEETHNEYLEYYRYQDDFMISALNTNQPKRSTDIMDYSQWRKTEYFNDFQLKNHFYYFAVTDIHYRGKLISSLNLIRSKKSFDFDDDELIALEILSPYIANHMYKLMVIEEQRRMSNEKTIKVIEKSISKFDFTERELDVINYVIKGKSNDEISDLLYLSSETVKKHLYNIFKKTNVRNRTEILAKLLDLI